MFHINSWKTERDSQGPYSFTIMQITVLATHVMKMIYYRVSESDSCKKPRNKMVKKMHVILVLMRMILSLALWCFLWISKRLFWNAEFKCHRSLPTEKKIKNSCVRAENISSMFESQIHFADIQLNWRRVGRISQTSVDKT